MIDIPLDGRMRVCVTEIYNGRFRLLAVFACRLLKLAHDGVAMAQVPSWHFLCQSRHNIHLPAGYARVDSSVRHRHPRGTHPLTYPSPPTCFPVLPVTACTEPLDRHKCRFTVTCADTEMYICTHAHAQYTSHLQSCIHTGSYTGALMNTAVDVITSSPTS